MTDAPMPLANLDDLPVSNVNDAQLAKLTERSFLPYLKLLVTSSAECESGSYKPGSWIFCRGKDNITDLTGSFEGLVIASRPRACRKTMTGILNFYDMESEEYKKVERDSQIDGTMGCWHGTEFLGWVRSMRSWVTYHASSETARGRSAELITMLLNWRSSRTERKRLRDSGTPEASLPAEKRPQVTFKSGLVTYTSINKKQWAPVFAPCTTPFSEYPSLEDIRDYTTKFLNPPKKDVETVQAGTDAASATEGRG